MQIPLLEGMFGQTAGIGSTSISKPNNKNISNNPDKVATYKKNINTLNKKIIKVVNFNKVNKAEDKILKGKIKIKTFLMEKKKYK